MSLDLIRKHNSVFTKGILIVLIITFVIGFGFSYERFGLIGAVPQGVAADVNGEKIPLKDFYRARENLYRQYGGQQPDLPEAVQNFIDMSALNQLIDLKLLSQEARELGFMVTDEELRESISKNPSLQIDGTFIGKEAYVSLIEGSLNESVGEFENRYRDELLAQKLVAFINETVKITDEELYNDFRMNNEETNLYYVTFSTEDFVDSITPSREEIKSHYEKHKNEFKTPELRAVRFLTLSPDRFEDRVKVSDEEIEAYYKAYPDEFRNAAQKIPLLQQVREEILSKLKRQRGELLRVDYIKRLEVDSSIGSIKKIAEENGVEKVNESQPFTASQEIESLPAPVRNKAFSMANGELSNIVVGNDIWIIEVSNISPSRQKDINESEGEVIDRIKITKAREQSLSRAEEFLNELRKGEMSITDLSKSHGLELKETGYFSRNKGVPHIGVEELRIDAFSLNKGDPVASKPFVSEDNVFVVSLKEFKDADKNEFQVKKAEFKETELSQRRNKILMGWLERLREEAKIIPNETILKRQG